MKVISIKQPWASLIIEGYKKFEFRSWATSYRGKVLIHASQNTDKNLMDRFKSLNISYPKGQIIGSVYITDCIKVEEEFENELIKENELVYGNKSPERKYAFKLEKIEKFKNPINARGNLSFWNYYTEEEALNLMNDISYGFMDKNKKIHQNFNESFVNDYILQTPNEIIKNKVGTCWDQVELERYYLKNNQINIKTYFLVYYDEKNCPTHTFLTYEKNNKYYWFEHAWEKYKGIHEYSNKKELLVDIKKKFIKSELNNKVLINNLVLYEYKKPPKNLTVQQFYKHCESGKKVTLNDY